jgi:hypothetical protein
MHSSSTDDKFMGMTNYIAESFHDLLVGNSEVISNSGSSRGRLHPSRECFIAGSPEGHVESVHDGELLSRLTPMMRSREMQESRLACGWSS